MAESMFSIFGDSLLKQSIKNAARQPLSTFGNENFGKAVSAGPIKPNEPVKKLGDIKKGGDVKKSFLANTGKALQGSTPMRQAFSPRAVNVGAMIYTDDVDDQISKDINLEQLQFTKPSVKLDNYNSDILEDLPPLLVLEEKSLPNTPPPKTRRHSSEFNCSYQDEFFTDDFSIDSFPEDDDLGLPDIF